jgi:hypothetical protein
MGVTSDGVVFGTFVVVAVVVIIAVVVAVVMIVDDDVRDSREELERSLFLSDLKSFEIILSWLSFVGLGVETPTDDDDVAPRESDSVETRSDARSDQCVKGTR